MCVLICFRRIDMNIIFDIGRVLSSFHWRKCCEELGFSPAALDAFSERLVDNPVWNRFDLSITPHKELIAELEERFPEYINEYKLFWDNTDNMADQFPYSENWLRSLKEQGHKIYLLSNYPRFLFEAHSKKWGFLKYIDGKVVSFEYHVMKPDPRIYNILLEKFSLDPSQCVFTDDRKENIESAENAGIKGIVFQSFEQASKQLDEIINSRI